MPILGRQQKRDAFELIILSVLNEREMYGYAIIKQVASQSEGAIRLTAGALYPLLHELENQKLITARWEEVHSDRKDDDDGSDGRRRKWYRITARGRKRLASRVAAHRAQQAMIDSFVPDDLPSAAKGGAS